MSELLAGALITSPVILLIIVFSKQEDVFYMAHSCRQAQNSVILALEENGL